MLEHSTKPTRPPGAEVERLAEAFLAFGRRSGLPSGAAWYRWSRDHHLAPGVAAKVFSAAVRLRVKASLQKWASP